MTSLPGEPVGLPGETMSKHAVADEVPLDDTTDLDQQFDEDMQRLERARREADKIGSDIFLR